MSEIALLKTVEYSVTETPAHPTSLTIRLEAAQTKIREDLFRFRTCCADPRASK